MKRGGALGLIVIFGVLLFVSAMFTLLLTLAIWPGEAKLVGPLLCPDQQSDYYVVTDTSTTDEGGTSYNFSLHCVGERGDFTNRGFGSSFLILWGVHLGLFVVLFLAFLLWRGLKARSRGIGPPDAETAEPMSAPDESPVSDGIDSSGPIIS